MDTVAVVLKQPELLSLDRLALVDPTEDDVVVDVAFSGVSTGTERLLWSGRMPPFPGMGYPLVPGYESVGRVVQAGRTSGIREGTAVFVPGARCFGEVKSLFGATAARLVVSSRRIVEIDEQMGERGILLALAATAYHAVASPGAVLPDRIVGHGVLGRLVARITVALGGEPVVWERNPARAGGGDGYEVLDPESDARRDCRSICDVSGDSALLDTLIGRLAPGGEIVLAGFYSERLSFSFPPAFMREARIRIAAEWKPEDLAAVKSLVESGSLSLDGLITHRSPAMNAPAAYRTAFDDPACLKLILDWSACQ